MTNKTSSSKLLHKSHVSQYWPGKRIYVSNKYDENRKNKTGNKMLKAHLTKHAFICKQVELFLSIIPTAGKLWISPPWTQSVLQSRDEMRFLISQSVSLPCWGQGDTLHGQVGAKEFQRGPAPVWPWPFDLLRVLNEKASSGIPDLLIKHRAEHNVCRFCHPRGHADYPCTIPPRAHLTIILFFFSPVNVCKL